MDGGGQNVLLFFEILGDVIPDALDAALDKESNSQNLIC
jgi:hypothetical protein